MGNYRVQALTQQHTYAIKYHVTVTRRGELLPLPTTTFPLLIILRNLGAFLIMFYSPFGCDLLIRGDQDNRDMAILLGMPIPNHTRIARDRTTRPDMLDAGYERDRLGGTRRRGVP